MTAFTSAGGDGPLTATHRFMQPVDYEVTARVYDGAGGLRQATLTHRRHTRSVHARAMSAAAARCRRRARIDRTTACSSA